MQTHTRVHVRHMVDMEEEADQGLRHPRDTYMHHILQVKLEALGSLAGQEARPEKGEPSCLTRLAQHVGKADISADRWVQLHPGGHGVQLPCLVQLIQEGLSREEASYREGERGREAKSKPGRGEERWQGEAGTTRLRKRRQGRQR